MNIVCSDPLCSPDEVGGKASGLNKLRLMVDNKFNIPEFTVITAEAFIMYLKSNGIKFDVAISYSQAELEDIKEKILYGYIPKGIEFEVNQWFDKANKPLCVRSSCIMEDGVYSSHAGIFKTFLNINKRGELWNCIREVWVSQFTEKHLEYCQKTYSDFSPMAVIIQELKCAAVSGVCFSDNKNTVIRATFGLGIGIVDGSLKSDTWIYSKEGKLDYSDIGKKEEILIPNLSNHACYPEMKVEYPFFGDNKYELITLKPDERHAVLKVKMPDSFITVHCIDESIVDKVYQAVMEIKDKTGMELVDMEWCLDSNFNLFILQVRPLIKALPVFLNNGNSFSAQPISGGMASGRLHIINEPEDIIGLTTDSIAVMNWMPDSVTSVLMKAAGIIIRSWQNMSHFALLVREWNIPCIAAVEGCTLPECSFVKINGTTGELIFIEAHNQLDQGLRDSGTTGADGIDLKKPVWPLYLRYILGNYMTVSSKSELEQEYDTWVGKQNDTDLSMLNYILDVLNEDMPDNVQSFLEEKTNKPKEDSIAAN
jgi:pyruvate,water dikinase